jgi:hypothetical protein
MLLRSLVALGLIAVSSSTLAQKIKLFEGDLKPLKGEKSIRIEFSYDSMMVGEDLEEVYVEKMKNRWNGEEPGKGDEWKQNWFDARKTLYEPSFNYSFSKASGISTKSETSTYTIVIRTIISEPGFHVPGLAAKAAWIHTIASIVKTEDPTQIIAIIEMYKYKSESVTGGDFGVGKRLQEAYIAAAAALGNLIKAKTLK